MRKEIKELVAAAKGLMAAEVVVPDMTQKVFLPPGVRSGVNRKISAFTKNKYFDAIPLKDLFGLMWVSGVTPVDEDGTEWSGMLLGNDARADFDLAYEGKLVRNARLQMMWHRMESGRYEVTAIVM